MAPYNKRAIREADQVRRTIDALLRANFYRAYVHTTVITSSIASSELALLMEMNPKLLDRVIEAQGLESVATRDLIKRFIDHGAKAEVINYLMQKNGFNHYLINRNSGVMSLIGYC